MSDISPVEDYETGTLEDGETGTLKVCGTGTLEDGGTAGGLEGEEELYGKEYLEWKKHAQAQVRSRRGLDSICLADLGQSHGQLC